MPFRGVQRPSFKLGGQFGEGETELTLENITADMTVEAVFEKIKAMPWLNLLLE